MDASQHSEWEQALCAAKRGSTTALQHRLAKAERAPSLALRAWCTAGRLALSNGPSVVQDEAPEIEAFAAFAGHDSAEVPLAVSTPALLRRYAIGQDRARFDATVSLIDSLRSPEPALVAASKQWEAYVLGEWATLRRLAAASGRLAQSVEFAELRVDATALRALAEEALGNIPDALESARTASRMARAEGVLESEFFASYVLARMRRWTGRQLIAASIVNTLAGYATPIWYGACQWEALLSEGPDTPERLGRGPANDASNTLRGFLQAARLGARAALDEAWRALAALAERWRPLASDVAQLGAALDLRQGVGGTAELGRWRSGEQQGPAPGLPSTPSATGGLASAVVVCDGQQGHRVPNMFARCLPSNLVDVGGAGTHPRLHTLLAVLGLAGKTGIPEAEAFSRLYGFVYEPELHAGRLGVLIHRAREQLGATATLHRDSGVLWLAPCGPGLKIEDPRTAPNAGERVLRFLLHRPAASAREVASALDAPLRSVQATLKELVEQELCRADQNGRAWSYCVEDTTFSPPTAFAMQARKRPL